MQGVFALEVGVETESVFADGGQVFAAGNAGDVFPCQCQEGGDASAYAAGTCNEIVLHAVFVFEGWDVFVQFTYFSFSI